MVNLGIEYGKVIIKVVRMGRAGQTLPLSGQNTPLPGGEGGRGQQKVCAPKIGLKFLAPFKNHLHERLLDQAQEQTLYAPLLGGRSRSIPQGMILHV